tara:strand:- start:3346 stop:3795 length:450 start_codon:yes stop_codon:yes gene_type:complete
MLNTTLPVKIKKMRLGRGIGSGKGKTSGRGVKGQKSRRGVAIKSFEGGQMPLYRRLPKRGFNPLKKEKIAIVNLIQINNFLKKNKNKIDKIDLDILKKNNLVNRKYNKLKILGLGECNEKIQIEANFISSSAKQKIEKMGGSITLKKNK